jgi:hypothetical protein
VLASREVDLLDKIMFKTQMGYGRIFDHSKQLLGRIETEDYGMPFAMYLHYEPHMTLRDILKLTQVGCKRYTTSRRTSSTARSLSATPSGRARPSRCPGSLRPRGG